METQSQHDFAIKTDVFEGPLDLLIELVEKHKLLINDISLAEVTDEYMRHVAEMQERSLPGTSRFVHLAATLLLIKSKSIIPNLSLSDEEEGSIADLEKRLIRYKHYRDAARTISKRFGANIIRFRPYRARTAPVFTPDESTTVAHLHTTLQELMRSLPVVEQKEEVAVKDVITLNDMISRLHTRLTERSRVSLRELVDTPEDHRSVIVGFLAVLESVKQGSVLVSQEYEFADIAVERDVSAPDYRTCYTSGE